jgi:hypothetical protein
MQFRLDLKRESGVRHFHELYHRALRESVERI